jgi:hypothetical protein
MTGGQRTAVPLVHKEEFKESWPQKRDSSRSERDNRVTEQKKVQLSLGSIHDCREKIDGRVESVSVQFARHCKCNGFLKVTRRVNGIETISADFRNAAFFFFSLLF